MAPKSARGIAKVGGFVVPTDMGMVIRDARSVGEEVCGYDADLIFSSVDGLEPDGRVAAKVNITGDTCGFFSVDTDIYEAYAVLERDSNEAPKLLAVWNTQSPEAAIPAGFFYEGGPVDPLLVCPPEEVYGDPLCSAACTLGVNTSSECPSLASVLH